MLKVVLRYTDSGQDENKFFSILSKYPVFILKSKTDYLSPLGVNVTVVVPGLEKLNQLVGELTRTCEHGVRVIKVKKIKQKGR